MKKTALTLLVLNLSALAFAGEKVDIKFSGKRINKYIQRKICVVQDDILSMSGDTADKNNRWRAVVFPLLFKSPAGKNFRFSGEIKLEKINPKARFKIAIRLVDAKGKSIKYVAFNVIKDQDWKAFSKTFTAADKTLKMQFYIIAIGMANESIGSVKNLIIEQL